MVIGPGAVCPAPTGELPGGRSLHMPFSYQELIFMADNLKPADAHATGSEEFTTLDAHATSEPIKPMDAHATIAPIKPLDAQATGAEEITTMDAHATTSPIN